MENNSIQIPEYKCHKTVYALKIAAIEFNKDKTATIAFEDNRFAPLTTLTSYAYNFKGNENDLGYYVRYRNGYESWSPTKEFEEGYTKI